MVVEKEKLDMVEDAAMCVFIIKRGQKEKTVEQATKDVTTYLFPNVDHEALKERVSLMTFE